MHFVMWFKVNRRKVKYASEMPIFEIDCFIPIKAGDYRKIKDLLLSNIRQ
ncbi:hypothetical protein OUHCRE11_26360 [Enterobacter asburiae]|nr:hypothetical protein ENTKAS01_23580 [Enterobacter sp. AS-1]